MSSTLENNTATRISRYPSFGWLQLNPLAEGNLSSLSDRQKPPSIIDPDDGPEFSLAAGMKRYINHIRFALDILNSCGVFSALGPAWSAQNSNMLVKFWHLVLDPDENLWLFEEQDATELQYHSSDAVDLLRPADTKFPYHLADKLLDRCNTGNHGMKQLLDLELLSEIRPLLFKLMLRLSRTSGLYPRCFSLTGLQKIGKQVAGGGYGDIWKGLLRGQRVCIKMMRIFQKDDIQLAIKAILTNSYNQQCLQLCHPNLLPFFGLYFIEERLCLISPWMDDGNIMEYLRANSVDQEHRISMIMDVALGLEFLHKQATVHGDLKGINILVTPSGRACIADFGLAVIINAMTLRLSSSTTINRAGTVRYQAPELVEPELNGRKTFYTDIYAFAWWKIPFYECPSEIKVMLDVMAGKRPSRAPSCSGSARLDCLWELMQRCWNGDPKMRPSAPEIVGQLMEPKIGATTTSSTIDWDHEFTAQFRRSLNMEPLLPSVNQLERTIFGAEEAERCTECFPDRVSPVESADETATNLHSPDSASDFTQGDHSRKRRREIQLNQPGCVGTTMMEMDPKRRRKE
ncbi:kinase-like domain-containing protein [Favolaschia claudopus]|uniref:Kinase-like domain-containing protein n=1 Tax=Favolaschia claudopus TaxID=2862362 RepID=A0AAV9ZUG1_9AGAR